MKVLFPTDIHVFKGVRRVVSTLMTSCIYFVDDEEGVLALSFCGRFLGIRKEFC